MPRKQSLNWFMPALAKSRVGSLCGISDEEGTTVCPRSAKKCRKRCADSLPVIMAWVESVRLPSVKMTGPEGGSPGAAKSLSPAARLLVGGCIVKVGEAPGDQIAPGPPLRLFGSAPRVAATAIVRRRCRAAQFGQARPAAAPASRSVPTSAPGQNGCRPGSRVPAAGHGRRSIGRGMKPFCPAGGLQFHRCVVAPCQQAQAAVKGLRIAQCGLLC
jgi:hypothetical protein